MSIENKECGCKPVVMEPAEFTVDTPVLTIKREMCRKHAEEYFAQIKGSVGTA